MKKTFLFPGQGSQSVGMGISVADAFPSARNLFDIASSVVGYNMYDFCAGGPAEKLAQTEFTQPALYTVEASITTVLIENGIRPDFVAGHSLGEFAAWYAAGAYSFEDGLRLVKERGRIMSQADPDGIGTMAAIIGLDRETIESVCDSVDGTVVLANINSPAQMVISGEKTAVGTACELLKEKGAKRAIPLKVSGAFHSPLMEGAKAEFADVVSDIDIANAKIPVISNVTASPVALSAEIRGKMVQQLTSPILWIETIQLMVEKGASDALEIGSGAVLAGLIKRIDSNLTVTSVSDAESIKEVANG